MTRPPLNRPRIAALTVTLVAALAACERQPATPPAPAPGSGGPPVPAAATAAPGFVEESAARGLVFKMQFLADEQGRNFKINLYDHGSGVAIDDVDGDGDDDVYLMNQLGPNRLFLNEGGKFTDVTDSAGVALADRISVGAVFGDLDGDGDTDLFVTTTRGGNVLFRNDGGAKFTDVTKESGVTLVAHSQSPLVIDYDADGDLDLFVTNTGKWTRDNFRDRDRAWEGLATLEDMLRADPEKNVLYRNDGGLRFTETAEAAGLAGNGWDGDAAPLDYDEDGDIDLFVANMFGGSRLLRNDGTGRFEDVTAATLGAPPWGSIGSRVLDADGDGHLDFFIADMHSDMWLNFDDLAVVQENRRFVGPEGRSQELGRMNAQQVTELRELFRIPDRPLVYGNALFRNLGNGRFEDTSQRAGVETWWPWGVAVSDFDLDGDEDIFLPSGMGYPWFYWRSALLVNRGDGVFVERGREFGIEPLPGGPKIGGALDGARSFRCAAVGDFDADGRPDLVVNAFNDRALLWMNRFPARRHLSLRLTGTHGPREAIGAVVTVRAGGKAQTRMVQTTGGYLSQSTRTMFFGIGDAAAAERVEIRWPGGARQTIENLAADKLHEIVEPK